MAPETGFSIIAGPYDYGAPSNNGSIESYLGLIVAVINDSNGAVTSKINESKVMVIDALPPDEVRIDTSNYKISDNNLAFGIRISRQNHVSVTQVHEEIMNVYMQDNDTLKNVVRGLLMASHRGEGDGRCKFSGMDTKTDLTIGKSRSNGNFDLIAKTRTTPIIYTGNESSCRKRIENPITSRHVLKYDGNTFRIPKSLKASLD